MRADSDFSSSDNFELLACRDGSFALGKRWGVHAQVTVDGDETTVLRQDFKSPWTLFWVRITLPGAAATTDAPRHRRQIDAMMVRAGLGMVRQRARTERRGVAAGLTGRHLRREPLPR